MIHSSFQMSLKQFLHTGGMPHGTNLKKRRTKIQHEATNEVGSNLTTSC